MAPVNHVRSKMTAPAMNWYPRSRPYRPRILRNRRRYYCQIIPHPRNKTLPLETSVQSKSSARGKLGPEDGRTTRKRGRIKIDGTSRKPGTTESDLTAGDLALLK